MAMGMTEDDDGRIWLASYPDSGVACFDPAVRAFRDYGHVYHQNWRQYQRSIAADDSGWIYFAVGNTSSQIVALEPGGGEARPLLAEEERHQGSATSTATRTDACTGRRGAGAEGDWLRLYKGEAEAVGRHENRRPKPIITGSQGLFHADFPDGARLLECDTVEKRMVVQDADGSRREMAFDYTSEGAHIMGLAAAPDGTICGGTAFPMRFFRYDPAADEWTNREAFGQWNTVRATADRFFVGGYGGGFLLEWDPARDWVATEKGDESGNPRWWTQCSPAINRPHCLLATADGGGSSSAAPRDTGTPAADC